MGHYSTVVGKNMPFALVDRNCRSIKSIDLNHYHRTETRVRAHVFICVLAAYLNWHLRQALTLLTFTDESHPTPEDPVGPAKRSVAGRQKVSNGTTGTGETVYDFTSLLGHLTALTCSTMRIAFRDEHASFDLVTVPTETQWWGGSN